VLPSLSSYTAFNTWGGLEDLFAIVSVLLGWTSVVAVERALGRTGMILLPVVLATCFAAIGGGFILSLRLVELHILGVWQLLVVSTVVAGLASVVRLYFTDIFSQ